MEKFAFNDGWMYGVKGREKKRVVLPHDAMLAEERDAGSAGGSACAFFPGNIYEYEKVFAVPEEWREKHVVFQFEGVYRNAVVSINGKKAGGAAYGYIPFFVDGDEFLTYGAENRISVTADNSMQPNSRWYSGGGIYRPVNLWVGKKNGIEPEGIRVTTVSIQPPRICVEVETVSRELLVEILDGERIVASGQPDRAGEENRITLEIPGGKLWSAEKPECYTCRVTLSEGGEVVDVAEAFFGIRKLEWSKKGFFVNGKETLLRGGCIHHDNGILGAAAYAESEWRRVRMLKQAGYNALRISHNPSSTAMLEACDALGMYMIDETWDMWYNRKTKFDYGMDFMEHYEADIRSLVSRDYNHPCVVMYSIGNEVSEPAQKRGVELAERMVEYFHALDHIRPVTAGINLMIISRSAKGNGIYSEDGEGRDTSNEKKMQGMNSTVFNMITSMVGTGMNKGANSKKADAATSPVLDALDIAGYNYASGRYPLEGKAHPDRVLYGSETFPQDIAKNWEMVKKYPYLVGDFMWTAWDYLGEAGIGAWAYTPDGKGFDKPYPWLLADVGALDILGNPNGQMFWAQAVWGLLQGPVIAVRPVNHPGVTPAKGSWRGTNALPTWSWHGCEGNRAVVEVYTDAAEVELYLNERKLGRKKVKGCRAVFRTKYEPGALKAVSFDSAGNQTGEGNLKTAEEIGLWLTPETGLAKTVQGETTASGRTLETGEVAYIRVRLGDGNHNVEANADEKISVMVSGGELLGFGSANPRTEERYDSGSFATYYGQALIAVRAGGRGVLTVTARGGENHRAECRIPIK